MDTPQTPQVQVGETPETTQPEPNAIATNHTSTEVEMGGMQDRDQLQPEPAQEDSTLPDAQAEPEPEPEPLVPVKKHAGFNFLE
ncbi:uncharacterized protein N7500_003446 [Penicillium coprophilum]|uniref:uncharacterized protein n=1 Tax=Penicillium coprophilum TaxID=36646 RepID=UPI00239D5B93|nr:uncharacterized protein N7500_003446 [Penicillium coprophilum]KAJ5170663.1 hypothetical protein N7500_003446 [Penicillium coprophilum]